MRFDGRKESRRRRRSSFCAGRLRPSGSDTHLAVTVVRRPWTPPRRSLAAYIKSGCRRGPAVKRPALIRSYACVVFAGDERDDPVGSETGRGRSRNTRPDSCGPPRRLEGTDGGGTQPNPTPTPTPPRSRVHRAAAIRYRVAYRRRPPPATAYASPRCPPATITWPAHAAHKWKNDFFHTHFYIYFTYVHVGITWVFFQNKLIGTNCKISFNVPKRFRSTISVTTKIRFSSIV